MSCVLTVRGGHSLAVVSESGQCHVEVWDNLRKFDEHRNKILVMELQSNLLSLPITSIIEDIWPRLGCLPSTSSGVHKRNELKTGMTNSWQQYYLTSRKASFWSQSIISLLIKCATLTCRFPTPARCMAWIVSSTLLRSLISTEHLASSGIWTGKNLVLLFII